MQCQPNKQAELAAAFEQFVAPSRSLAGTVSFDITRDLVDANVFIATEVFGDMAARECRESPGVAKVMSIVPDTLGAPPETTVSSSDPAMYRLPAAPSLRRAT